MSLFDNLLTGSYPKHLCDDLESAGSDEVRLNLIQRRIEEIDRKRNKEIDRKRIEEIDTDSSQQLPFERRILGAIEKDLRSPIPRGFLRHNRDVFDLIGTVFRVLDRLEAEAPDITIGLNTPDEKDQLCKRLRVAAFLHDTGKALEQARHPVLGWHVMMDLASIGKSDKEAKRIIIEQLKAVGRPDLLYRWLARLVRDHDKFGVISTGEASYVILGSMVNYGRGSVDTSLTQLRDTWLLNLADIGGTALARPRPAPTRKGRGTLPQLLKVRDDKFQALTSDWKTAVRILKGKSFSEAIDGLRQESETPEFTVQRIRRLLIERSLGWGPIGAAFSENLIEDALETHFAPRYLLPFCRDLGMVAKLDYALQFWSELADYVCVKEIINSALSQSINKIFVDAGLAVLGSSIFIEGTRAYSDYQYGERSPWIGFIIERIHRSPELRIQELLVRQVTNNQGSEEIIARTQTDLLIAILRRVVTAYRGLIRGGGISDNAPIGVGFSYLRSDDKEKRLALYELLSSGGDGRERGLRWLIDEVASWELLA